MGTVQAGCDGATSATAKAYAPHRTEKRKEQEKNASRAAAMPSGPPPSGDGNGKGRTLAELRDDLAGYVRPWLPDGGATGRRIAAEIAKIEARAGGQPNARACEDSPAATASPAPAGLAERSAKLEAMACV